MAPVTLKKVKEELVVMLDDEKSLGETVASLERMGSSDGTERSQELLTALRFAEEALLQYATARAVMQELAKNLAKDGR